MTLARRSSKSKSNVYVVDADTLPQTIAVIATRAEPLGIEVRVARPGRPDGAAGRSSSACTCSTRAPPARCATTRRWSQAAHDRGRAGHRRRRPARAVPAARAGRDRRRHRGRQRPALRRADGLRRPARRLPRGPRRPGAVAARPPRRGVPRRRRPPGVPAGPADPRAAHPPGEGDQQHLHRPGAARRDGQHVRRLPRPGRAARHRRPHPPDGRRRSPPACATRRATVVNPTFFDTLTVAVPGRAAGWSRPRPSAASTCGWSTPTGSASPATRPPRSSTSGRSGPRSESPKWTMSASRSTAACRAGCGAPPTYLTHPVFHAHRSETAMLRYLRSLADKDYALDRGMIPLGSCTMKLNATTEMEPVTWPEFANMHPFAPAEQTRGLRRADRPRWRRGWPSSPATTR